MGGLLAQDLAGTWQGTVKNPDTQQSLRTVLKISPPEGGLIKANFYSIDQTYLVFPGTLTVQGSTVKMKIPGIGAEYEGKLNADSTTMTGTVKGFSVPAPWNMKKVTPEEEWALPKAPTPPQLTKGGADPVFEVASIKRGRPDAQGQGVRVQGINLQVINMPVADLLRFAYDLHPHQIIGGPAWLPQERFDITAKVDGEGQPNQEQLRTMLKKLLAERFQFASHADTRELPVYTLNLAKGGVKLTKNDPKTQTNGVIFRGPGSVLLNNSNMDDLCRMLQNAAVDRPVVNQTGLGGRYDFSLVWTPDRVQADIPNPNALTPKADAPPDLFEAVQQQLGLKLDSAKLRIDVLVIDKIERPSEN
jgi:uncharacterized protein (TIGR03435 family)